MKRDVIYLAVIGCLMSVIWINMETIKFMDSKHEKESKALLDSLSKANGIIKEYKKFYPYDKENNN